MLFFEGNLILFVCCELSNFFMLLCAAPMYLFVGQVGFGVNLLQKCWVVGNIWQLINNSKCVLHFKQNACRVKHNIFFLIYLILGLPLSKNG